MVGAVPVPPPGENETWCDVPLRAITHPPRHHYFGYYDKTCWDGSGRHVVCLESEFLDRPQAGDDVATIGVVDLEDGDRFRPIARTRAWNWQQGAMLHWLPVPHATGRVAQALLDGGRRAATPQVIHNDRLDPGEE